MKWMDKSLCHSLPPWKRGEDLNKPRTIQEYGSFMGFKRSKSCNHMKVRKKEAKWYTELFYVHSGC
jgi:hypothetical protein